jgi:site-specific recombinase XerD
MTGKIMLLKNDGLTKNGYPIKLILSHDRKIKRKKLFSSFEADWNNLRQLPKPTSADFENKYDFILSIKSKLQDLEFQNITDFETALNYLFKNEDAKITSFYSYFEKRIDFMQQQNRKGNAKVYAETLVDLKKFKDPLTFKDITMQFLNSYKLHKKDQGLKNTSIKKNLVTIRAVYNSAIKDGHIENFNPFLGLFTDLPIIKRRAKNYYLGADEILRIETIKTVHVSHQRCLDLALIQFYLGGADLIDIFYLKKTDIENGRVFLKRRKNGERAYIYDVKLTAKAENLIYKYTGDKEYIFPWRKSFEAYITFRNNHNRNIKRVQKLYNIKLMPKNGNLTTKVMRHSFATLAKFKHYDQDLIRELMGHERNDIDTIYKDKYPEAERDAMQEDVTSLK